MAMNAKVYGNGKQTLVLAHGYGGSQAVWDEIVPNLAQKYKVLVFDWSFSGAVADDNMAFNESKYSSYYGFSEDLISLIDEMRMTGVVYVGHSMAGMIGCIASIKRPDLFGRLVLVGASPRYMNTEDYQGGFDKTVVDNLLNSIESSFLTWAEGFIPLVLGSHDPIFMDKYGKDFVRMKPKIALSVARTVFLSDYRDVLDHVEVPCTVFQGTNDAAVPISVGHYIQSKIKGKASLEIVEMDGHCPQITAPEKLIEVLHRYI